MAKNQEHPKDFGQESYEDTPQEESNSSSKHVPVNVATQNWKSGFALGKTAPMPSKDWKKSAGLLHHSEMPGRPPKEKKERKPIAQISEKKKARIKEEGSEGDLFKRVALERSINGYVMAHDLHGKKKKIALEDLQPINFSHIKAKGMNKSERMNPDNIEIVTFANHFKEHTGQNYSGPTLKN